MTDRERQMIAEYLPNPPDPTLEFDEFYFKQNGRVIKVLPLDIMPHKDGTCYGLYTRKGGRLVRVDEGWGDPNHGAYRHELYDNKKDCRDQTHCWYENWESLRDLQRKEGLL